MKRLMDEVVAWYVEAMHYSASTAIRVDVGKATSIDRNPEFWLVVLETFSGREVKKGPSDCLER